MDLVDIGANLTHESFAADRDAVIARARSAGVRRLVVTGATVDGSRVASQLATAMPGTLFFTAGVHPHHAADFDPLRDTAPLRDLLRLPGAVAAGECGLDYFRNLAPRPAQRRAFEAQVELASQTGLPLFLHQRDAHGDFMSVLRSGRGAVAGVAHCFTGGPAEMSDYLDLGLHIGITGWLCDDRRAGPLRDAVRHLPLDRVLLETDAPYLLPRTLGSGPFGRRNEPMTLPEVLRWLAHYMSRDEAELAAASTANAERLFGLV